jgi:phenylpropionate dioxygenase-like ring-hydroxylating dioxygenase large terminal subunit
MDETRGFAMEDHALIELRLETWAGFLFLNFDADAESLESYLGDLPELMRSYRFEDMRCTQRKVYDLDCNWKIYVENAMESYHVPTVHMKTLQKYCGLFTRHEGSRALLPGMQGFPYIPNLEGDAAAGTYYILIYPSTMLGCTYDCMWWLELHPQGPARTQLTVGSCFPGSTVERADFDELVQNYYRRWEISITEDNEVSDLQQVGLSHRQLGPGQGDR